MGFSYSGQPVAGLNEHGKVVVAALDGTDQSLWLVEEGSAVRIGTGVASIPALYSDAGVPHVAARAAQDSQVDWQRPRGRGGWAAGGLPGPPTPNCGERKRMR